MARKKNRNRWFVTQDSGAKEITKCHKAWIYEKRPKGKLSKLGRLPKWLMMMLKNKAKSDYQLINQYAIYSLSIKIIVIAIIYCIYLLNCEAFVSGNMERITYNTSISFYLLTYIYGCVVLLLLCMEYLTEIAYVVVVILAVSLTDLSDAQRFVYLAIGFMLMIAYLIYTTIMWRRVNKLFINKICNLTKDMCCKCSYKYECIYDDEKNISQKDSYVLRIWLCR